MLADDLGSAASTITWRASSASRPGRVGSCRRRLGVVLDFYRSRLAVARATWDRVGGTCSSASTRARRPPGARTTAARTRICPASPPRRFRSVRKLSLETRRSRPSPGSRRRAASGSPECAFVPAMDHALADAGVRVTVLDAHGLESPRRARGAARSPVLSPNGVAYVGRDPDAGGRLVATHRLVQVIRRPRASCADGRGFNAEDELRWCSANVEPLKAAGLAAARRPGRRLGERRSRGRRGRRRAPRARFRRSANDAPRQPARAGACDLVLAPFDAELFGHQVRGAGRSSSSIARARSRRPRATADPRRRRRRPGSRRRRRSRSPSPPLRAGAREASARSDRSGRRASLAARAPRRATCPRRTSRRPRRQWPRRLRP